MHRADAVPERNRRPWTDFTTGDRSTFPAYHPGADTFVARPTPKLSSPDRPVRGGGVGSAALESQRKRYRDLDGEVAALAEAGTNPFRLPTMRSGSHGSLESPSVLPVPALHPPTGVGLRNESATHHIMSARADIRAVPGLARALGASADRLSPVGGLLRTLASWHLSRGEEARRLGAARKSLALDLRRLQHEVGILRDASGEQASALERSHATGIVESGMSS